MRGPLKIAMVPFPPLFDRPAKSAKVTTQRGYLLFASAVRAAVAAMAAPPAAAFIPVSVNKTFYGSLGREVQQ